MWSLLIYQYVENDSKVVSVMAANLPEVTMFPNQTSALALSCQGRELGEGAHTAKRRHRVTLIFLSSYVKCDNRRDCKSVCGPFEDGASFLVNILVSIS